MNTKHPSLAIRPTQKSIRQNLLKDLEKEGYVVLLHTGEILTHPKDAVEEAVSEDTPECPK